MKKYILLSILLFALSLPLYSDIVPPNVGQTQIFNVLDQGFFQAYYKVSATCQMIGDSYYLFTEDARVNDISCSPTNPDSILLATDSGLYISGDGGQSWQFVSGSGTKIISPDNNAALHDPEDFDAMPLAHRAPVNSAFFMKYGEWWAGCDDGGFQTKDDGETWVRKTRGLPNYVNEDEETIYPAFYSIVWDTRVTDYTNNTDNFACTQAGLFYWLKSKYVDLSGGLPKTVSDWDHFSVYDFTNDEDVVYAATELGIYKGDMRLDDEIISWLPLGGGTANVDSAVYDTTKNALKIYLDGADVYSYVNLVDTQKKIYWSVKTGKEGSLIIAEIDGDNVYFSDETVFDPDTLDYETYLATDMVVYLPANVSATRLYLDDSQNVYYISGGALYMVSSTDSAELVYNFDIDVYDMLVNSGSMYIAAGDGLYKADLADLTTWSKETGSLAEGDSEAETVDYDVRSIEISPAGDIFIGCHFGGIMKRAAGAQAWTDLNLGIGHRGVVTGEIEYVSKAFDSLQVDDTVVEWFGEKPDVDNDSRQYCLIVDLQDYYYLDAGDGSTYIDAFFDPEDQLSKTEQATSNMLDIIYIDSDPLNLKSSKAWAAVTNALTVEIIQSQEVLEVEWVYRGLAELGELIVGLKDTSAIYKTDDNNNLMVISDKLPTVKDYDYCFLFFDYLYSHYLNTAEIIRSLVAQPAEGLDGVEAVLDSIDAPSFAEVYSDFSAAIFFDQLQLDGIDPKFKFPDLKVENPVRGHGWGFSTSAPSPYLTPQAQWSNIFFSATGWDGTLYKCPGFSGVLTFNGEDDASYSVQVILKKSDGFLYDTMELDANQYCYYNELTQFGRADTSDHSREYQKLYYIVTVHESPDLSGTSYIIHDENVPVSYFMAGFNHNSGAPEFLNIFNFSSDRIFDDAAKSNIYDTDGDGNSDIEGPIGYLVAGGDTTDLALSHFSIDDAGSNYVYTQTIDMSGIDADIADIEVVLSGQNITSSDISTSAEGTLAKVQRDVRTNFVVGKNLASINLESGSLNANTRLLGLVTEGNLALIQENQLELETPLTDILMLGPTDIKLNKTAWISMKLRKDISTDIGELVPVVFRNQNGELKAVTIAELTGDQHISFATEELGSYQVFMAKKSVLDEIVAIPDKFALRQNYPNPFNSSTIIRYQLPRSADVRIEIYNLVGQKVRTLQQSFQTAGYYSVEWNGYSDANRLLPSGVYLYRMTAGDFTANEKMIYLK